MIVLSWGCGHAEPADRHDSAADVAPCDLLHPWELGSVEDVAVASAASASRVASLLLVDADAHWTARAVASNGETCPTYSESADGVTVTVSGDCTTEWGYVYAGSGTFTDTDPGSVHDATYDQFAFDARALQNDHAMEADGAWAMSFDADGGTAEFDLTLTLRGDLDAAVLTAVPATTETYVEGTAARVGYVDILAQPSSTATGDLCVDDQARASDSCEIEDDRVETLWGTRRATLTWDGSTACDGCAAVAVDGVALGMYCP